ncbi:MAG: 4-alpha-glucanotransferase [Myxococcales bacterium]|nr:4-alpha-glucanotransferase [Myxococcales bacterium]
MQRRPRVAGVTVPLFSLRTRASWGIGSISDLLPFAAWIADAGITLIQLLPLAEGSGASASPYAALSAFGIDPIYIDVERLPGFGEDRVSALLDDHDRRELASARASARVDYAVAGRLKRKVLRGAFDDFYARESREQGELGREFIEFMTKAAPWLDNLAVFRALKALHGGRAWWEWPAPLRDRHIDALAHAQAELEREILFCKYQQWVADRQWSAARAALRRRGVELMGDLPFMVDRDSADVWAHRDQFHMDMSVGVPADQFDEDGQDWGMPPYHWEAMALNGFAWLRRRCAHAGHLYDRFRIDHLVGFYRTYMRPLHRRRDARGMLVKGVFSSATELAQRAHGEMVITAMIEGAASSGGALIAEDLGSIPDYVHPSLARLEVPGYKVLIWETAEDGSLRDPKTYPALSVACFGTHDTDPVAVWWEGLVAKERAQVAALLGIPAAKAPKGFSPAIHEVLLRRILGARSELVLLLMQDVLGTRERVNKPGTLGEHNWTYRLPASIEALAGDAGTAAKLAMVKAAVAAGQRRLPPG